MSVDGYGKAARKRGEQTWAEVAPPEIEHEDRLTHDDAQDIWNKIYAMFSASGETGHKEARLAVYAYYAANGASQKTMHARDMVTGGGANVLAADVRDVIGSNRLRKFLRADVDDAYSALKETEALERDEVFVHKAMQKGVPRGFAHCAVDFLRGCSLMTPEEQQYADIHFTTSIQRARAARGGVKLEEEERSERGRMIDAQRESSRVSTSEDF